MSHVAAIQAGSPRAIQTNDSSAKRSFWQKILDVILRVFESLCSCFCPSRLKKNLKLAPLDLPARIQALPLLTAGRKQQAGEFFGRWNQFQTGEKKGTQNVGVAACSFCAMNMMKRLWQVVSENRSLGSNRETEFFIRDTVREGVQLRAKYHPDEPIEDHVAVADVWDANFKEFDFAFVQTPDEVEQDAFATYQLVAATLTAEAYGIIGATILKGPETHTILIDARNQDDIRYYHSDSHGFRGGPAYVSVFDRQEDFVRHLSETLPFVENGGEVNRLQVFPYSR